MWPELRQGNFIVLENLLENLRLSVHVVTINEAARYPENSAVGVVYEIALSPFHTSLCHTGNQSGWGTVRLCSCPTRIRLSTMATQRTQSIPFHSSSFRTKEGIYKKGTFQYCRETRKPHSGKELAPVSVSFVSCKDKEGQNEWITFNSAKEFYFYPFYGMRKVSYVCTPSQHL